MKKWPARGRAWSREQRVATWLVTSCSLSFVGGVSLLDAGCFFELGFLLRFVAVGLYLAFALVFLHYRPAQAIAIGSVSWMLVLLPQIRWNYTKSFYVDARRIEPGMTAHEVRRIMSPYLELGGNYLPTPEEQQWLPPLRIPRAA